VHHDTEHRDRMTMPGAAAWRQNGIYPLFLIHSVKPSAVPSTRLLRRTVGIDEAVVPPERC
jgi:hypothetical protein